MTTVLSVCILIYSYWKHLIISTPYLIRLVVSMAEVKITSGPVVRDQHKISRTLIWQKMVLSAIMFKPYVVGCTLSDHSFYCAWKLLGNYLETTWKLLGNNLETTWKLHGNYMEATWKLLGNYLETTWKLHGNYLETTWKLHIHDAGVEIIQHFLVVRMTN